MNLVPFILAVFYSMTEVRAHGYLYVPPQRSSAWRFGYNVPRNYNDMGLFCGGFARQWNTKNGGKCGVCGDPYDGTRHNEAGGKYAKGIITGSYNQGDIIVTRVKLTAYHKGWFEYRLCSTNDSSTEVTQACLDQNVLQIVGNNSNRLHINGLNIGVGIYEVHLQLPANMACERCVLQWKYNTGNSWGCFNRTNCGLGKGNQEQFINCADIRISGTSTTGTLSTPSAATAGASSSVRQTSSPATSASEQTTPTSTSSPTSSSAAARASSPTEQTASPSTPPSAQTTSSSTSTSVSTSSSSLSFTTTASSSTTASTNNATPSQPCKNNPHLSCSAIGIWQNVNGIPQWCINNCRAGYCPPSMCSCTC